MMDEQEFTVALAFFCGMAFTLVLVVVARILLPNLFWYL